MTTNEFADLAMARVEPARPFETQVLYDPDGDCIEFLISNEGFFAERIDSLVTVYYGRESGEIVGSLIKGVRRIIARATRLQDRRRGWKATTRASVHGAALGFTFR
jgi:hypothetical protein